MENVFNSLIDNALKENASDIHIEFENNKYCLISYRINGKVIQKAKLTSSNANKLINYIVFKANLDVVDNQTLHTGIIKYLFNNREISLRVSVVFAQYSKGIVIRILNNHKLILIENLSIINNNYYQLKEILSYKNGLIIFSGKTGSGKTTTLYAIIEAIKMVSNKKIITLEEPIEREINDILQISVNSEIITYFDVLKQVLRHDPDVIVIGEIRDESDLKLAIQAALSGHLVITSMHAMSAVFAINRLCELKISNSDLKACLKLISYQELFYTSAKEPFCIYEFINNEQVIDYLNDKSINYNKIIDYRNALKKEVDFYEGK
ncbi:competence protein ComGA [Bacilli bacterium PM5-3]|nr:competence protein ComGA [Bacilli bacterium PM5-3]MDH6603079.1 competence protein ComGA [Bacilli bacterium PM5-9]